MLIEFVSFLTCFVLFWKILNLRRFLTSIIDSIDSIDSIRLIRFLRFDLSSFICLKTPLIKLITHVVTGTSQKKGHNNNVYSSQHREQWKGYVVHFHSLTCVAAVIA